MTNTQKSVDAYIFHALAAAHRKLHDDLNQKLKELNVQVESWRVLQSLRTSSGTTMSELANIVLMKLPTLSKLVDRMVADGLVQRQLSPQDLRCVHLMLTDLGVSLCDRIQAHAEEQDQQIIATVGPDTARLLRIALHTLR